MEILIRIIAHPLSKLEKKDRERRQAAKHAQPQRDYEGKYSKDVHGAEHQIFSIVHPVYYCRAMGTRFFAISCNLTFVVCSQVPLLLWRAAA